ncbi:MAG TPA: response regulator transcription factor [Blastocatellia bacterium]|nr:response regulator transcription factor [Blastocatellia bacterium]
MPAENNGSIRIMVVDDHPIVRHGFADMISAQPRMKVVAEAENGLQAVELFRKYRPDITLMDLRMPRLGGVDAIKEIRKDYPDSRIIVLTTYDGEENVYRALQAGAQGYLLKHMSRDEILSAIQAVHAGKRSIPDCIATRLAERTVAQRLTSRESEILNLMGRGMSNKQIATMLAITEPTVKGHVSNILDKLGVTDRTQAVTAAIQRGIIFLE